MGTRIASLVFVSDHATLVYNTFKCDPITGATERTQSRREYTGENNSAQVRAFAIKCLGSAAEHCVALEVAPGLYSVELPSPDDAKAEAPKAAKGK
jgi:hypothetical protein